jgi:hypothetical protein
MIFQKKFQKIEGFLVKCFHLYRDLFRFCVDISKGMEYKNSQTTYRGWVLLSLAKEMRTIVFENNSHGTLSNILDKNILFLNIITNQ